MAQAQPEMEEKIQETPEMEIKEKINNCNISGSKLNVQAPEFVPRSHLQIMPAFSGYYYPYFQFMGGNCEADWFYIGGDQEHAASYYFHANNNSPTSSHSNSSKNFFTDDIQQKIVRQVEYQFSDMSLLANESFAKQLSKDPEGYVPVSFIASTKKIKSLLSNNQLLAEALKTSSKLVLSEDGKKVRRKHPFTEKDKEELQSRTVVAENLPEDHSHHNLEKLFGAVGSVKTIRMCYPQESNTSRTKTDFIVSNKLHALVEYESTEIAEAAERLTDERNWRKGLRVRLLLRCSPKSVLKTRRSDFDCYLDEDDASPTEFTEDLAQQGNHELFKEGRVEDSPGGSKKGLGRGRGKNRARTISHVRGSTPSSQKTNSGVQPETPSKQIYKGPRMPDGTKGFSLGRGKPVIHN